MTLIKDSAAEVIPFLLILSSDHISPATGAAPTVLISKNGGSFGTPAGAVSEIGNGWYKVAGNAVDTNTLGYLVLHATAAGCDPTDALFEVEAATVQLGAVQTFTMIGNVQGAVGSVTAPVICIPTKKCGCGC